MVANFGSKKSALDTEILESSVKSQPNNRMLIPKTYLHFYNLGLSLSKYEYPFETVYKWFRPKGILVDSVASFLMRVAGEPPELVDSLQIDSDLENLRNVYFANGFFHAEVEARIDTFKRKSRAKKANITFIVNEGAAYIIDTVSYHIADAFIEDIMNKHRKESFIQPGDNYNEGKLTRERARISDLMRKHGYYLFSPAMISYEIDTTHFLSKREPNNNRVKQWFPLKVEVHIPEDPSRYFISKVTIEIQPSSVYPDDVVYVFSTDDVDEETRKELRISRKLLTDPDTLFFRAEKRAALKLNLRTLTQRLALKPGGVYSLNNDRKTQKRLQELGVFKYIVVRYEVIDSTKELEVFIETQLSRKYQAKIGAEAFYSTTPNSTAIQGNFPGIGAELSFRDRLLFRGGEQFEASLKGNFSFYKTGGKQQPLIEIGVKTGINVPRFMLPFISNHNLVQFNPRTSFSANFDLQRRFGYDRTLFGLDWNYSWYHIPGSQKSRSSISPYIISFIDTQAKQPLLDFIDQVTETNPALLNLIALDFQPRFSSKFSYNYTYTDYGTTRKKITHYLRPIAEFGGNTPFLIDLLGQGDDNGRDGFLTYGETDSTEGTRISYGQFGKLSFEYKSMIPLSKGTEIVFRGFTGIAAPLQFTTSIVPFDARFYTGGTNSMRGWQSNTLGPGIFTDEQTGEVQQFQNFLNLGGEFIMEGNLELRVDVWKWLELGLFTDVGNVWFLPTSELTGSGFDLSNGKISRNTFHLGWDAGVGIRLDFSFFIFRLDIAQQLYAPDLQEFLWTPGGRLVIGGDRLQFNFGIGYPF